MVVLEVKMENYSHNWYGEKIRLHIIILRQVSKQNLIHDNPSILKMWV